jgi:integrase/recombinase XerD
LTEHAAGDDLAVPTGLGRAELAAWSFLTRYTGATRKLYATHLRIFFLWCALYELDPLVDVRRVHVDLFIRYLDTERGNKPATISNRLAAVKGFYRLAVIDGVIEQNPAEHVMVPKTQRDPSRFFGLDRRELGAFLAAAETISSRHHALAHLLGLLGLRVSEACRVRIEDFTETERGHRILRLMGKGNKPAVVPLPQRVLQALEAARDGRTTGPLLLRNVDGEQLDRHTAACMVATIARRADIQKNVTPHTLRRSVITNALDAGVSLRDAQIMARHADPRTTTLYDVARRDLDGHGVHRLTDYLAEAEET